MLTGKPKSIFAIYFLFSGCKSFNPN